MLLTRYLVSVTVLSASVWPSFTTEVGNILRSIALVLVMRFGGVTHKSVFVGHHSTMKCLCDATQTEQPSQALRDEIRRLDFEKQSYCRSARQWLF